MSEFQRLSDLVPSMLAKHNLAKEATAAQIINTYHELIRAELGADCTARGLFVREKILYVAIGDSCAAQRLHFAHTSVLPQLQERHPDQIENIRLRVTTEEAAA